MPIYERTEQVPHTKQFMVVRYRLRWWEVLIDRLHGIKHTRAKLTPKERERWKLQKELRRREER